MRAVVASLWLLSSALAGCGEPSMTLVSEGTRGIPRDEFLNFSIEADGESTLNVDVQLTEGIPIDVFLMDEQNFQWYAEGGRSYTILAECKGEVGPSLHASCLLSEGSYRLVFDNTWNGQNSPNSYHHPVEPIVEWSIHWSH